MKSLLFFIPLLCFGFVNAQQIPTLGLKSVQKGEDGLRICFTVKREANVRQYVIEASTDSTDFEIISTLTAKGNTVLPRAYEFIASGKEYPFYRIKQMAIDGTVCESLVIRTRLNLAAEAVR